MANFKNKSEKYWKEKLTDEQYEILREKGTEAPFTGELLHTKEEGTYVCGGCMTPLFSSETKFDSGSGWPSFFDVLQKGIVELVSDDSLGMQRTEVVCATCGGHLGHVFADAPEEINGKKTGGQRYCINSAALSFRSGVAEGA